MAKRPRKPGVRARELAAEIERAQYARIPIAELVPWERNPRTRMDEGSDRLATTIGAVGWGADVLVQAGSKRVIGGHLRLMAARKLGLDTVPCKLLDVDDARADEIALADNRAAEFAAWDVEGLATLLGELEGSQRDVLGWSAADLDILLESLQPAVLPGQDALSTDVLGGRRGASLPAGSSPWSRIKAADPNDVKALIGDLEFHIGRDVVATMEAIAREKWPDLTLRRAIRAWLESVIAEAGA